jgi:hypothetical protein
LTGRWGPRRPCQVPRLNPDPERQATFATQFPLARAPWCQSCKRAHRAVAPRVPSTCRPHVVEFLALLCTVLSSRREYHRTRPAHDVVMRPPFRQNRPMSPPQPPPLSCVGRRSAFSSTWTSRARLERRATLCHHAQSVCREMRRVRLLAVHHRVHVRTLAQITGTPTVLAHGRR